MLDGAKAEKHWWLVHHEDTPKLARAALLYGGNLYNDKTWMSPTYLASLGIRVWHCTQRVGDLIVVPPMVPHQVADSRGSCKCSRGLGDEQGPGCLRCRCMQRIQRGGV
jgi:hypothetical protein